MAGGLALVLSISKNVNNSKSALQSPIGQFGDNLSGFGPEYNLR